MPYLIPATNNYFGFMPATNLGAHSKIGLYLVSSSEASDINPGDVCVYATHTSGSSVRINIAAETLSPMVGVAASRVAAGDGSTGASTRALTSQNILIYDSPYQLFVGCDTTSGVIGGGVSVGRTFQVVATGVTGSTGPNGTLRRSVQALSGVTSTAGTGLFKLVGLHPVEDGYSTGVLGTALAGSNVRKWIVTPNNHVGLGAVAYHITT